MELKQEALEGTACSLLLAHLDQCDLKITTKAYAVANAKYNGMLRALDRLRLGSTETAIHMDLVEAVRNAPARPPSGVVNSQSQRNWDAAVVQDFMRRAGWVED